MELNPAPVTNIVQQFGVCSHEIGLPGPYINQCVQPANFNYQPRPNQCGPYFQPNPTYIQPCTVPVEAKPHSVSNKNHAFDATNKFVFDSCQSFLSNSKETELIDLGQCSFKLGYEKKESVSSQDLRSWFKNTTDFITKNSNHNLGVRNDLLNEYKFHKNSKYPSIACSVTRKYKDTKIQNSFKASRNKGLHSPSRDNINLYKIRKKMKSSVSPKRILGRSTSPRYIGRKRESSYSRTIYGRSVSSKSKGSSRDGLLSKDGNSQRKSLNIPDDQRKLHGPSERENLLAKWRKNYYSRGNLDNIATLNPAKELQKEKLTWTRTTPADLYYQADKLNGKIVYGTEKLSKLCDEFEEKLIKNAEMIRSQLPKYEPLVRKKKVYFKNHSGCPSCRSRESSDSESELEDHIHKLECRIHEEIEHKKKHPLRLHPDLWFNTPGEK